MNGEAFSPILQVAGEKSHDNMEVFSRRKMWSREILMVGHTTLGWLGNVCVLLRLPMGATERAKFPIEGYHTHGLKESRAHLKHAQWQTRGHR